MGRSFVTMAAAAAALFSTLLSAPGGFAQSPALLGQPLATPATRISAAPSDSILKTLHGNTPAFARAKYDQGVASAETATGTMALLLRRSPAQQEALTQYLGALQNPKSGYYHQWLTPQTFGANFGISTEDLQTVENWLTSEGFKIENVPASRGYIQFSGNIGQVETAFHTSIHRYQVNGVQHYSNNADPQIPAALAPVVLGVSKLNDLHPRPQHVLLSHGNAAGASRASVRSTGGIQPQLTVTLDNSTFFLVTPSDAATIYDSPNGLNRNNANYSATATTINGNTGAGVSIGLVGDSDLQTTDYANFRKLFLGEATPPAPTTVIDGTDPGVVDGDEGVEALLDAENAAGLAPGASIYFYSSNDDLFQDGVINAATRAIEDNNVSILSVSFGACEADEGAGFNLELYSLWQQAAAQGITVDVSSGDSGSASCDGDAGNDVASEGLSVSGWASTPYNVAVGGTDFDTLAVGNGFDQYVSTTATPLLGTSTGYIPENPWNDSITNLPGGSPALGSYTTNTATQYYTGNGNATTTILAGSGGGVSSDAYCPSLDVNSDDACASSVLGTQNLVGYPIPSFQQGSAFANTPLSGSTVRNLPDVALFASPGDEHSAGWPLCSDSAVNGDSAINGNYTDCTTGSVSNGVSENDYATYPVSVIGGTSADAPAFSGMLALVENAVGHRLGQADNILYNLAATHYSTVFHDVTVGNNSMPCQAGSTNCGTNSFLAGYNAGTNFDLATGLGSVDVTNLANAWAAATFTPTTVTLTATGPNNASTVDITHGQSVTLTATVSPAPANGETVAVTGPTGLGGAAVNEVITLTNGTGKVATTALPGASGAYNISAYYPGDATLAPGTSASVPVTVTPETSTIAIEVLEYDPGSTTGTPDQNPTTIPYGFEGNVAVQPQSASGSTADGPATGTVTLQNNGATLTGNGITNPATLSSSGIATFPLYYLPPAAYKFAGAYSGDDSYKAGTSATRALTITQGQTSLAIQASSSSIPSSASVTVQVQLSTDSVGAFPTGNIALTGNGQTFTATSVEQGTLSDGAVAEVATFTVQGSALASGSNTLTASYGGDSNYSAASNVTTNVTVTSGSSTSGFSVTGPSGINIASTGGSGTGTIAITPGSGGFSGTVALTCKISALLSNGVAPTCSLNPASVALSGTTAGSATVTVATTASAAVDRSTPLHRLLFGGSGVALGALLLFGMPARRRGWQSMLAVLLVLGLMGAAGCGSTSNAGSGTQAGTYTLTVTGTSGSVTSTTSAITVTVQ